MALVTWLRLAWRAARDAHALEEKAARLILQRLNQGDAERWRAHAHSSVGPELLRVVNDSPPGTLGAAYRDWLAARGLGLNPITAEALAGPETPMRHFLAGLGVAHDLTHVLYHQEPHTLGEATLAAHLVGNMGSRGSLLLIGAYLIRRPWHAPRLARWWWRGRHCRPLVELDWVDLAGRPTEAARAAIGG